MIDRFINRFESRQESNKKYSQGPNLDCARLAVYVPVPACCSARRTLCLAKNVERFELWCGGGARSRAAKMFCTIQAACFAPPAIKRKDFMQEAAPFGPGARRCPLHKLCWTPLDPYIGGLGCGATGVLAHVRGAKERVVWAAVISTVRPLRFLAFRTRKIERGGGARRRRSRRGVPWYFSCPSPYGRSFRGGL